MNTKTLALALLCLCGGAVSEAAGVKVSMNSVSKTMTLASAATGDPVDTGLPSGTDYSFDAAPGEYVLSAFAADGTTLNGTITITIADSADSQEFKVLTCTAWATNDNNSWRVENGDYSLELKVTDRDGASFAVTPGTSTTAGRLTFPALAGTSYYAAFVPGETRVAEGYTTLYKSGTLTANVNVSGAIPKGEDYTVTVPEDAEFQMNMKFSHFVDFTPVQPSATVADGGMKSLTYHLAQGQVYNYRTWRAGGLTRAGYFTMNADPAKRPALAFAASDYDSDPAAIMHDPTANGGYETGDIFLNINERGHLPLRQGESFRLHAMRTWELTDNTVNNYFIEPDFHYTVIDLDGQPSQGVVEISSRPGSAWADVRAVGEGEAIVLVTYDAIGLEYYSGADRKAFAGGDFWGAVWPENTGVFVVTVGGGEAAVTPAMTLNEDYNMDALRLAGSNVDAEHDVFYYLDTEPGALYTFRPEGVAEVTMARPAVGERMATYTGFGTEGVTRNDDGSYTLTLVHGRQIVRLADASGRAVYQVLTAKECHREIMNASRPGSSIFQPGDEVKIQYSGLYHPANKIAGVYNMSAYVTYNGIPNGSSLMQGSGQYTFGSAPAAQAVTFSIPADHDPAQSPAITMSRGTIQVNGFGDPIGSHRNIDDVAGRSPNFSAIAHKTYCGIIPDTEIPVSAVRTFDIETVCDVEDAKVTVSYNGTELAADSRGLYSGTYGSYDVVAVAEGYRCFRESFVIGDDADGIQTFSIAMTEAPLAWDGVTLTEPELTDGVYRIADGDELAWLADRVNTVGGAVDAVLVNDIDLGNFEWKPIGNSASKVFAGTFDGAGHTVEGLFISDPTAQYQGLFGYVKGTADRHASISGVTVKGSVSAKTYAGGLAGYVNAYVDIDRCANLADVTGTSGNIGGITGYVSVKTSTVSNCYNTGTITGASNCGGIVGGHGAQGVSVRNVFNLGEIDCPKNAGACVGSSYTKKNLENVFAVAAYDRTDNHTLVSDEQMQSGEVAYRLGKAFGQEIGTDPHPVLGGTEVRFDPETGLYYNHDIPSGIDGTSASEAVPVEYFNLEGIPSASPRRGINLVRMSDGTVRKLIVR